MTLAGVDKIIGKEDRATLGSDPSALSAVKQSAPAFHPSSCFAAQSENPAAKRHHPAPVAALFVMADSHYKSMTGVDAFDIDRDALTFAGGMPIVAHPPCRSWANLSHFAKPRPGEKELGPWAIEQVRKWGGVLEHPAGSRLFDYCGCPRPYEFPDSAGGWTIQVDQYHWGHKARKRTRLYIVGTDRLPPLNKRDGRPQYVVSSGSIARGRAIGGPSYKPGISHKEREASPPAFADFLVSIARRCV